MLVARDSVAAPGTELGDAAHNRCRSGAGPRRRPRTVWLVDVPVLLVVDDEPDSLRALAAPTRPPPARG